ncbi:MAG: DNA repair protein RadC [Clostridia bacterium]|nr:DNA repair protein RadC [Clostridia bacterium]MDD4047443.1 DNA repair protein RadC [Clostridia bacterium]
MCVDDKVKHISIKDYPEEMRPREKLISHGADTLADHELLAILLRTGTKEKSALDLAQDILLSGGLTYLTQVSTEELSNIKGIGLAKAAQVKAALELGRRLARQRMGFKPSIHDPSDAASLLMGEMSYLDREHFKVINLNTKNQVIMIDEVSVGSLNASLVHPREVFKLPIKRSAASLILAHNHPSGDTRPSKEDVAITERLCEAGNILGVKILDHIILGQNSYLSMKEKGYFA